MGINERLKLLRKTLNLTMEEFGKKVGVTKFTISRLEKGDNITEPLIKAICNIYNVNQDWFKYGNGEMFETNIDDYIEKLAKESNFDDLEKSILKGYIQLDSDKRKLVTEYIRNIAKNYMQTTKDNKKDE